MNKITIKEPNQEIYKFVKDLGKDNIVSTLLSNRVQDKELAKSILNLDIKYLESYKSLKNVDVAGKLIAKHILNKSRILLVVDYDADGNTSAATIVNMLVKCFNYDIKNISLLVNERRYGNGVNDTLVDKILVNHKKKKYDLLISADHGSSDEERFKRLKEVDIDLCITDHHLLPKTGVPVSADIFVNPQQPGCEKHKKLSGCAVAYYTMLATRDELVKNGVKVNNDIADDVLSFVAVSTIADSMDMSNLSNRYIVKKGLSNLFLSNDVMWKHFNSKNKLDKPMRDIDVSFKIAPLINAASRMNSASSAAMYLLSSTYESADINFRKLNKLNAKRKERQNQLMMYAKDQVTIKEGMENCNVITLNNAMGVNGIVSTLITIQFGLPTVTFHNSGNGTLSGSGRSSHPTLNIRECYEYVSKKLPHGMLGMGGHAGAAGCSIREEDLDTFKVEFDNAVLAQLPNGLRDVSINVDMRLEPYEVNSNVVKSIDSLRPFGIGFDKPLFVTRYEVDRIFTFGKSREHAIMKFKVDEDRIVEGMFINGNGAGELDDINTGSIVDVVYCPDIETYKGKTKFKLKIEKVISV